MKEILSSCLQRVSVSVVLVRRCAKGDGRVVRKLRCKMGERIGKPLTEQVGRPRVLPDAVPLPLPTKVPEKRDPVPVPVLPDGTEAIAKAAKFLGLSEAQVREILSSIVSRISATFHKAEGLGKAPHVPNAP